MTIARALHPLAQNLGVYVCAFTHDHTCFFAHKRHEMAAREYNKTPEAGNRPRLWPGVLMTGISIGDLEGMGHRRILWRIESACNSPPFPAYAVAS